MEHGRTIRWSNNMHGYSISGYEGTPEELLEEMIEHLIKYDADTFKPRVKWWQFWRERFYPEITAEYIKQTT